jgi:hypothetical protein
MLAALHKSKPMDSLVAQHAYILRESEREETLGNHFYCLCKKNKFLDLDLDLAMSSILDNSSEVINKRNQQHGAL